MLFFLVYILFVIICPSTVANVLIYFSQVFMLPSYRTILVHRNEVKGEFSAACGIEKKIVIEENEIKKN